MKRTALMVLPILILLLGSACVTAAPAAATAPPASSAVQPTNTEAVPPTAQPAQAEPTQSAPASAGPTRVDVTLADNTITSSLTDFKVGVPYTFVITNNGRREHNFNINQPIAATGSLQASLSSALLVVGKADLPAGGSKTVEYTFPAGAVGLPLELSCLITRHYDDGMRVAITLTE